jgi:proliferating cell nuclear antigen PCNA
MIKLVMKDAKEFYKCIDAIGVLINEGLFTVDKEKFFLRATDPSQISLVDFVMPKDAFEEFIVDIGEESASKLSFGININNLLQILSHTNADDKLSIEIKEGKPSIQIEFIGKSKRSFTIPLIDVSDQQNPLPQIPFDVTVQVGSDQLVSGIKDAALFSSHLTLRVNDEKFILETQSSKGKFKQEVEAGDIVISGNKAKAMFPLDYLQNMIKNAKTTITIKLKDDMPIEINYTIGSAAIRYYLAPRVDNE